MRKFASVLALGATTANAMDYYDARITGIGLVAGEDHVRFMIDKDPNAIFTTTEFEGEQLKRLVALLYSSYHTGTPIYFIRSSAPSTSSTRCYTECLVLTFGAYTFD